MQSKGNFLSDNEDILFHLKKRVNFHELFKWCPAEEKEAFSITSGEDFQNTWLEVLNTFGEYSGSTVHSNADAVSKENLHLSKEGEVEFPPAISENVSKFVELGGPGIGVSPQYSGMGGCSAVIFAMSEMIARACPSTMLNVSWFSAIAEIVYKYGNDKVKEEFIPQIASGSFSGSMALTEPDAGSDLSNIRSYGEDQGNGTWKIFGTKQFITNGSGQVCLVLAKNAKGAKGLKTMNLFLVPRIMDGRQNFKITKLEEKPGIHGSATCAMEFDGSIGYLLGENGKGFNYMTDLMNEARIAVGFQGLGLLEATCRMAHEFAEQRKTFGKAIAKHELVAEKLFDMEVDTKAFRSLCYQAAYYDSLIKYGEIKLRTEDSKLSDDEKKEIKRKVSYYKRNLRSWTPLIKYWCGEKTFEQARLNLQIHGGYGYSVEYKPEWWVRESLILSIYEGTSQIQALMCLKDTFKDIMRRPTEFAEMALGTRWKRIRERDPVRKKVYKMRQIYNSALLSILLQLVKENARDTIDSNESAGIIQILKILARNIVKFENMSPALLHAERLTKMKSIVGMARCLLWDAKVDPTRTRLAEEFIDRKTPILASLKAEIDADHKIFRERFHEINTSAPK
ncbi:MAG: acyl-CoA dehydrogenase family protein [Oligoflexales bacterium]|nr:acyl-CoA dehydrogenase family protein [Oligoflexales bacterium]